MSQITDPLSKFKLWFFRDMSDEQRLSLFALHGYPVEEMQTHAIQRLSLDHLFKTLSTPPVGAETGEDNSDA